MKFGKLQQKIYDRYVYVANDTKQMTIMHMKRHLETNRYDYYAQARTEGMARLEAVSKTAIWTIDNDKLQDAITLYCHNVWKELLNYEGGN